MIKFIRITNKSAINSYLIKDDLYKSIIGVDNIKDIKINTKNEAVLLGIQDNKEIGLVLLQDLNNGYVNFHTGLFKEFRHTNSLQILKQALKAVKRLVYPLHLIATIPIENHVAQILAEKVFKFKKIIEINSNKFKLYVE